MPFEIVFDNLPIGYAVEAARGEGQTGRESGSRL